mgnify:CR=1 FL=1
MTIQGHYGAWFDKVTVDGAPLSPAASQRLYNHSPGGFAWGYAGSGPAQLALAILLVAGVSAQNAMALHQEFERQFIQGLPQRGDWHLEVDAVGWAIDEMRKIGAFVRT